MNGSGHKILGAVAGASIGLARVVVDDNHKGFGDRVVVAVAAIGGVLGGMLPDILEPATSPNHRGVAHSWVVLLGLGILGVLLWRNRDRVNLAQAFRDGLVAGYCSHLIADSVTPKALPLIG